MADDTVAAAAPAPSVPDYTRVRGPDGRNYRFPKGTDKATAIKYFKAKNILGPPKGAAAPAAATATAAPTAAGKQEYQPLTPTFGHYTSEIVRGAGRTLKGMASYVPEAAKLRPGEEAGTTGEELITPTRRNIGPVGRFLLHTGEDFLGALGKGYEARQRAKQSGEGVAGQVLATLEQYPIIGAGIQHAELGGPGEMDLPTKEGKERQSSIFAVPSPEALGGATEIATFAVAPKIIDKVTGMVKPELLRRKAGDMNALSIKVAKGETPEPVGLRVAQEHVAGSIQELPKRIEAKRLAHSREKMRLAQEHTATGATLDITKPNPNNPAMKGVDDVIAEWKTNVNKRGQYTKQIESAGNDLINNLKTKADLTQQPVMTKSGPKAPRISRNLDRLTMNEAVDLTMHNGLLANAAKFSAKGHDFTPINNLAIRLTDIIHDRIEEASPELHKERVAEGELIEARNQAQKNLVDFKNDRLVTTRSIFRAGGTAIATYLALKTMGVPFASAYAIPVLLFNALRNTKFVTNKAAMYVRLADMIDGITGGSYTPPSRLRGAPPPTGGATPPTGQQPPISPPVAPAGGASPQGVAPQALRGAPAPQGGSPFATGGTAPPTGAPATLATGTLTTRPALPSIDPSEAPPVASVKETNTPVAATPSGAAAAPARAKAPKVEQSLVPAKLRQTLMDEIDRQTAVLDNPKSGAAVVHARSVLDQVKTLLDEKKLKGLSEAERKQLLDRLHARERQRKVRERSAAQAPVTTSGTVAPSAGVGTGAMGGAERQAVAGGMDPLRRMEVLEMGYKALAEFQGGQEFADTLKREAQKLQTDAAARGVEYDPDTEVNALTEALHLMREQEKF